MILKICPSCKKEYKAPHRKRLYCSNECRITHWKSTGKFKGKNNGMFGKTRVDVIERNKSDKQRLAVTNYNKTKPPLSEETKRKIGSRSKESRLKEKKWQKEDNPYYTPNKRQRRGGISKSLRGVVLELNDMLYPLK